MIACYFAAGPVSAAAIEMHRVRLTAACYLMARWYSQGMRSVRLNGSRVEPEPGPPDEAAWAIDDLRAAEALVATVLLGERYTGWHQMVLLATQEAT